TDDLQSLQIQPDAADPLLAQQQARFNALVRDVALWRAALADWNARIDRYQLALEPVHRELRAAWRQWVFALDHASLQPGFSRAERAQLGELLRRAAASLLQSEADAEIAAVAGRHGEAAPGAGPGQEQAEPEDEGDERVEDPAQDWEQQAAAAAARRERR